LPSLIVSATRRLAMAGASRPSRWRPQSTMSRWQCRSATGVFGRSSRPEPDREGRRQRQRRGAAPESAPAPERRDRRVPEPQGGGRGRPQGMAAPECRLSPGSKTAPARMAGNFAISDCSRWICKILTQPVFVSEHFSLKAPAVGRPTEFLIVYCECQ
jgi:hypothetical protein